MRVLREYEGSSYINDVDLSLVLCACKIPKSEEEAVFRAATWRPESYKRCRNVVSTYKLHRCGNESTTWDMTLLKTEPVPGIRFSNVESAYPLRVPRSLPRRSMNSLHIIYVTLWVRIYSSECGHFNIFRSLHSRCYNGVSNVVIANSAIWYL